MACQMDLGQCLFRHMSSSLQLRFAATASLSPHLNQLGNYTPASIIQWLDTASAWITEAPGLEMRLRFSVEPGLETVTTALVSNLGEKLCSSSVWANLGLGMVFKSCDSDRSNNITQSYCLTFGLYREHKQAAAPGRPLPAAMKNPPDAHAPMGTTTVTLAAIDISLQYGMAEEMCHQQVFQVAPLKEPLNQAWYTPCHYPTGAREPADTNIYLDNKDVGCFLTGHFGLFSPDAGPYSISGYEDAGGSQPSSLQSMFHLLESALQRLIFSTGTKYPHVKIVGENRLQSLSKLAPAVFSPGYREAMNQRAVSIPIITRALTSMLENSPNPIIQGRLSFLLQESSQGNPPPSDSNPQELSSIIQSSLWKIAQSQLRKTKSRKPASFLLSDRPSEQSMPGGGLHQAIGPDHAMEDEDLDSYLGSEPDYRNTAIPGPEMTYSELLEPEDAMLLSTSSESSFRDISESTQTTVDFPLPSFVPSSSDGDAEMLFADCDMEW